MPCGDLGSKFGTGPTEEQYWQHEINKCPTSEEVLLCSACRALVRLEYDFGENPMLDQWWNHHQRVDEMRAKSKSK